MRFRWTSLILAPLVVPVILSTMLAVFVGENWLPAFLTMLVLACAVSYGATVFLFLPCLFLLSLTRELTGFKVCLLGFLLGAVVFVALTLIAWGSISYSGPPIEHPFVFFLRWAANPVAAMFPVAGLTTAGLYWWLGKRASRSAPVQG